VADVKDALEALTNPENLSGGGRRGMRAVNAQRVLDELGEKGAGEGEGRALVLEALGELGGKIETRPNPRQGLRQGGALRGATEDWYVPIAAVRNAKG
jgi:hypothetical protein